jgi:hypothetical protein
MRRARDRSIAVEAERGVLLQFHIRVHEFFEEVSVRGGKSTASQSSWTFLSRSSDLLKN